MNTKDKIKKILIEAFPESRIQVVDDSARHAGHAEALRSGGGHFSVIIVSEKFRKVNLMQRHRMVYEALRAIKGEIHALGIKACTPEESR